MVDEDALRIAIRIVVLPCTQRPQQDRECTKAEAQRGGNNQRNAIHVFPLTSRSALRVTSSDELAINTAAISGVTMPIANGLVPICGLAVARRGKAGGFSPGFFASVVRFTSMSPPQICTIYLLGERTEANEEQILNHSIFDLADVFIELGELSLAREALTLTKWRGNWPA